MTTTAVTCWKAVHRSQSSNYSALWITDDVLTSAYHSFFTVSRTRKRFGSSVPGPLEAQRRLAKRKLAGLAAARGAAPFDFGALFGNGPPTRHELRWQAPRSRPEMFQTSAPPNPHEPFHLRPLPNDGHEAPNLVFDTHLPPIEDRIRAITTIEEVMALQTELEGHLDPATFSHLNFEALLANQAAFHSIQSFLRNPTVNVAEAKNFATFFAHPFAANISPEDYDMLVETLQSAIKVGRVLESEIMTIVPSIKELVSHIFHSSPLSGRQNKFLEACQAIWEGLKACRVTTISSTTVLQLLDEITLLQALPESKSLRLELSWHAWPASQTHEANLGEAVAEWAHLARLGSLDAYPNIPRQMNRATLLDVLEVLPSENRLRTIVSTTRHLADRCTKKADDSSEWKDTLIFWLDCLQSIEPFERKFNCHVSPPHSPLDKENPLPVSFTPGWREVYCLLSARLPETELLDHFKPLPPPETCRILLNFWIPRLFNTTDVTTGGQRPKKSMVYTRLIALDVNVAFEKKVAESASNSEELQSLSFTAILLAMRQSGLSYCSSAKLILDLVFKMYGPITFLKVLRRCISSQLQLPMRPTYTTIKSLEEDRPRLAYLIWRCCRIEVSHFPQLVISLIHGSWVHSAEIFQMLQYKAPTDTLPMKRTARWKRLVRKRNDLLHLMASAFANTRGGSSLVAFRNVEYCYWYLVERRLQVQPAMARALVHAGITRPLQNNEHINFGRCTWILGIVRALEGDEVADQLKTVIWRWRTNIRTSLPSGPRTRKKQQRMWLPRTKSGMPVASWSNLSKEVRKAEAAAKEIKEYEQDVGTLSSAYPGQRPMIQLK